MKSLSKISNTEYVTETELHEIIKETINILSEYKDRVYTNNNEPLFWEFEYRYGVDYVFEQFFQDESSNTIWLPLINPHEYKQALREFVKYGKIERYPTDKIYKWIGICLKNIALLYAFTVIAGHTSEGFEDEFVDWFFQGDRDTWEEWCEGHDEDPEYGGMWTYFEECGFEKWFDDAPTPPYSDYGLEPLMKLAQEYKEDMSSEQVLILINKILDVVHCRGDLASLFVHGGTKALSSISNK